VSILNAISKSDLLEFLSACAEITPIDIDAAFNTTYSHIQSHDKRPFNTKHYAPIQTLKKHWYASLKKGDPDYTIYADDYYVCELWLCWIRYSRRYLNDICKTTSLGSRSIVSDITASSIVDLGCGFGYTTAGLAEIFPKATVVGTNLPDAVQSKLSRRLGRRVGFKVVSSYARLKADLVFASEYFEHFERPVEHLVDVIQRVCPSYWLVANSFGTEAIGHFKTYKHGDSSYDGKQISRLFSRTMRDYGYERVKTKCWNNRPAYWKRAQLL